MTEDPRQADEGGVLGNLPRSRPGRRSEKRDAGRPSEAAEAAARKAEATSSAAAESPRAPRQRAAARPVPPKPEPDQGRGGAIGEAIHAATTVAGAGLRVTGAGARVAGALAHELLRRVPRP
jgi:hypothetical protein